MKRRIDRLETLMDLSEAAGQISAQPNTEVSLSLRLPTGEAPGEIAQVSPRINEEELNFEKLLV